MPLFFSGTIFCFKNTTRTTRCQGTKAFSLCRKSFRLPLGQFSELQRGFYAAELSCTSRMKQPRTDKFRSKQPYRANHQKRPAAFAFFSQKPNFEICQQMGRPRYRKHIRGIAAAVGTFHPPPLQKTCISFRIYYTKGCIDHS